MATQFNLTASLDSSDGRLRAPNTTDLAADFTNPPPALGEIAYLEDDGYLAYYSDTGWNIIDPSTISFSSLSPTTTKGDLIVRNSTTDTRLAVGTNGFILYSDSGESTGIRWAAAPVAGEVNTASNVGVGGVGVFELKSGENLQFRSINAASSKISVTLDSGNKEVDIDVVEANLTLSNFGGVTTIAQGGTGQITAAAAFNALSPITAKADLITSNGTNDVRLAVGSDGYFLKADSAQTTGLVWAEASSSGYANIPITGDGSIGNPFTLPQGTSTQDGYLYQGDWATFNSKIGGTLVSGRVPFASGTTTLTDSANLTYAVASGLLVAPPTSPGFTAKFTNNSTNGGIAIANTSATGYAAIDFINSAAVSKAYAGFANASAGSDAFLQSRLYLAGESGVPLAISTTNAGSHTVFIRNISTTGYSGISFTDPTTTEKASLGFAQSAAGFAPGHAFLYSAAGIDWFIAPGTTTKWKFVNSGNLEMQGDYSLIPLTTNNGSIGITAKAFKDGVINTLVIPTSLRAGSSSQFRVTPSGDLGVDGYAVFNESGGDVDFRVEGDTDGYLLFLDASADKVSIGTQSNVGKLTVNGSIAIAEIAAPGTPSSGYGVIYEKTDGTLYFKNDSGTEYELTSVSNKANINLSNLASTTINTSLIPGIDDGYDLGTSALRWRDGYFGPDSLHLISTAGETGTATDWRMKLSSDGYLSFSEASNNYAVLTRFGKFGVGISNPTEKIHTDGYVRATEGFKFGDGSMITTAPTGTINGSGVSNRVAIWNDSDTLTSNSTLTYDGSILTIGGSLTFPEISDPYPPASGYGLLYEKTDGYLYFKNDDGKEFDLTPFRVKGDLIGTDGGTDVRILIGQDGYVLTAASGETTGIKWGPGVAESLGTTGLDVNIGLASAPTVGQVLTATGATTATWQAPASFNQQLVMSIAFLGT